MDTPSQPFYFDPKIGEFMPLPEKDGKLEVNFFKSNVNILTDERPAIISWEVLNASKVRINKKPVTLSGSMTFYTFEPQTIKLVATNKNRESIERSLYIGVFKALPKIVYFKLDKSSATKDSVVTLSWHVIGAFKISIDNGIGDVTGKSKLEIVAYKDVEYKLTAKNYFGDEVHAFLSFSVFPSQLIQSLIIPIPEFNIRSVSLSQLTIDLQTVICTNIEIKQPIFASSIEPAQINLPTVQILLRRPFINSILFPNYVFKCLNKKQREINNAIKLLWKTNIKEKLKSFQV